MAKPDIVQKLRAILSKRIKSECEVVYLLAECRKLLDGIDKSEPQFALKLYCHWALHVDLVGHDTTLPLLKMVDNFAENALADKEFAEQHRMYKEFAFLASFRELLKEFLQSHELPTQVCEHDEWWNEFVAAYANVIEDGSLSCNAQPGDLKLISGVTFSKGRPLEDADLPFDMVWKIHLLDGRTLTTNAHGFGSKSGTPKMIFWGIKIH